MQHCSNSSVLTMELPQSCTKLLICKYKGNSEVVAGKNGRIHPYCPRRCKPGPKQIAACPGL